MLLNIIILDSRDFDNNTRLITKSNLIFIFNKNKMKMMAKTIVDNRY